jgi:sialidase-1
VTSASPASWKIGRAAVIALPLLLAAVGRADDWPQWRGPNRDGVWRETGILATFPADGLKARWRVKVGPGWSSPVVAGGRVYLTDSELHKPRARERVHCFEEATGKLLWTHAYEVAYPDWAFPERGPTATPIVRDGKLYTLGNKGDLHCFEAVQGAVLWKRNLEKEYGVQEFAFNASPLIEGERLIVGIGSYPGDKPSSILALDTRSGKEVWKEPSGGLTNSSPIVISAGGKRQLIVWTQAGVVSLDPATGKTYWREKLKTSAASAVTTPVFHKDLLLLSGLMLKLAAEKPAASVLWPDSKAVSRRILSVTSTGLIRDGHVFSARSSGELVCLEASTGKQVWQTDKVTQLGNGASIHLTPNGDGVFLHTDRGELIRALLTGRGYQEISRTLLLVPTGKEKAWAAPAYANRHVFARNHRELICASLAAPSPAADPKQAAVFVSGRDGYHTYRIPALLVTNKGTLLAFCEGRKRGRGDAGDIDVLLKRSFDGGKTWAKMQVVWDDGANTCGNPCPVLDARTGTIWLLLTHNLGRDTQAMIVNGTSRGTRTVWVTRSADDGATWSKPVEITRAVKKPNWTWYATGPGVGIQLKSGRLVVPCDNQVVGSKVQQSHVILSDDGGKTWELGGVVGPGCNESQVVELQDGRVMLNIRSYRGQNRRLVAFSKDGGRTFSSPVADRQLIEPVCQASILRYPGKRGGILFSNPASTRREKLTVRLSRDEGKTWPHAGVLHAGPAAYSCLAVLPDGMIACLYERGTRDAYETITCARFALDWLTENRQGSGQGRPKESSEK